MVPVAHCVSASTDPPEIRHTKTLAFWMMPLAAKPSVTVAVVEVLVLELPLPQALRRAAADKTKIDEVNRVNM